MENIPISKAGFEKLKAELDHLKKVERPAVIQAIAEARAHGDLSENAEYDAAKEKQGHIEGKIRLLDHKIACARIIEVTNEDNSKIVFGKRVYLKDINNGREVKYSLVGAEAEYSKGEISVTSPIGKQLLGHEVDNEITIKLPARTVQYKVLKIENC